MSGNGQGAPRYDAAVGCDLDGVMAYEVEEAAAAAAVAAAAEAAAAEAAALGGGDADDDSSDGGAAHEELSAWLHSTDDWWIS